MSRVLFFVLLLALALAQFTLIPRYMPLGVTPDILFVLLFYRFLRASLQESLLWVFLIGIVLDVLALDRLGAHALAMIPLVLAAQPLRVRPWLVNPITCTVLIGMAALFNSLFVSLTRGAVSIPDIALQVMMQVLLAPVGYWLYRRLYKR